MYWSIRFLTLYRRRNDQTRLLECEFRAEPSAESTVLPFEVKLLGLWLEVSEDFEDDREVVEVVEEGLAHLDVQVLSVVEGQRSLRVLHRLSGEGFVVAVEEAGRILILIL